MTTWRIVLCAMMLLPIGALAQQKNKAFEHYLSYHSVDNSTYTKATHLKGKSISEANKGFLPQVPLADSLDRWVAIARWEFDSIIVTLGFSDYYQPKAEDAPYGEHWLVSFDKQGNQIDYCMIGKYGDLYDCRLEGVVSPQKEVLAYRISVDLSNLQGNHRPCDVSLSKIQVHHNGVFSERFVGNATGRQSYEPTTGNYAFEMTKPQQLKWLKP